VALFRADAERVVAMSAIDTFQDLITKVDPPVERAALVLARDAYPQLDIDHYLRELDRLAVPLVRRIAMARTTLAQAGALGTYVYDELGFHGDEQTYYDPRNSYLNDVIDRKTGIPITLAVVLIALGTRAGLTVEGVGFPGHFLVRVGGETGGIHLDPFFHARVLQRDALERLLRRALGDSATLTREHLAPVGTRAIIARMLTNLKAIYESRREHARALLVCDRLVDLTSSAELRRDRGTHALALGAMDAAAADFEAYLRARPDAPDADAIRAAYERAKAGRARVRGN
jgi:regulator of sirC expression with transglutaminase-like and TPR domain